MIELKKIPLSKLFKIEVGILLREIIDILEKYDFEALRLKDFHELLVLQLDKAQILMDTYGVHPTTPKLEKLHKKRLKYAALINMQLKSLENVDCNETLQKVEAAQRLSKMFLSYLGQKRLREVELQISAFFSHLELPDNASVASAYLSLGLQPFLDELKKTNNLYTELYNQRAQEIKERPKTSDRVLEKETVNLVRLFFDQLNSYQRHFEEIDYSPLISELNVELTGYSKLLKTRIATNKRISRKKALAEKQTANQKYEPESEVKVIPIVMSEEKAEDENATSEVGTGDLDADGGDDEKEESQLE